MDSNRSRSRSKFNLQRDNYSENGGSNHHGDDLHDPDMNWHKFSGKGSGAGVNHHNKSSQMSSGGGENNSAMRRTVRNDKIDGVHDRRNKYLGA